MNKFNGKKNIIVNKKGVSVAKTAKTSADVAVQTIAEFDQPQLHVQRQHQQQQVISLQADLDRMKRHLSINVDILSSKEAKLEDAVKERGLLLKALKRCLAALSWMRILHFAAMRRIQSLIGQNVRQTKVY